ncbi:MAG: hypothetical protein OHK0022_35750 [Roseiflexaceae bacterium]
MPARIRFQIIPSPAPIDQPVTKFGGQPVWVAAPTWPLDPETGEPMLFLAQIALDGGLFPGADGTVVYLFYSAAAEPLYGEAIAAVIQRGGQVFTSAAPEVSFVPQASGPAVFELDAARHQVYREYQVIAEPATDEPSIPLTERYQLSDLDLGSGYLFSHPLLAGNKFGGQPLYIEGLDTPPAPFTSDEWLLLMQLAPEQGYWAQEFQPNFYPFFLEMGEFGIMTVFIARDYTRVVCYTQQP